MALRPSMESSRARTDLYYLAVNANHHQPHHSTQAAPTTSGSTTFVALGGKAQYFSPPATYKCGPFMRFPESDWPVAIAPGAPPVRARKAGNRRIRQLHSSYSSHFSKPRNPRPPPPSPRRSGSPESHESRESHDASDSSNSNHSDPPRHHSPASPPPRRDACDELEDGEDSKYNGQSLSLQPASPDCDNDSDNDCPCEPSAKDKTDDDGTLRGRRQSRSAGGTDDNAHGAVQGPRGVDTTRRPHRKRPREHNERLQKKQQLGELTGDHGHHGVDDDAIARAFDGAGDAGYRADRYDGAEESEALLQQHELVRFRARAPGADSIERSEAAIGVCQEAQHEFCAIASELRSRHGGSDAFRNSISRMRRVATRVSLEASALRDT